MQELILANPLENLTRIEYHGQLVLTTAQLAEFLSTPDKAITVQNLSANFKNNESRFIIGKHYFKIEGDELDILRSKNFGLQISPKTRIVYLWTKRGVARHCKSVGTETAWDVFELLEDAYFNKATVEHDAPLDSVSDFERGKALAPFAQAARDPYTKKRLIAKAVNLILGEEFIPVPDWKP
ncbi:MAG: ORF6N domain-containing protein, partial [Selenomonadaceae bacterium]|nr:ORF6N domain-containing protein [Selenomonadaceae bacterium]